MPKKKWIGLFLLGAGVFFALKTLEASGTIGAEFLITEVPASSAAQAAGVARTGGSEMLVWNPAGILGAVYPQLAFTHFSSFVDTAYEQLEGTYPGWLDGNWAVRLFYASTYNFAEINAEGLETGSLENHDALIHIAYARPWGAGFSGGLSCKVFESVLAGFKSDGVALDAGLQYQTAWEPLRLGAAVQNLGQMTAFDEEADSLPMGARLGATLALVPNQNHHVNVSADINQPLAGDEQNYWSLGAEYNLQQTFFLRAGYRFTQEFGNLSLGGGIRIGDLGLDYAYQPFAELGDNHRFTLSYIYQPHQAEAVETLAPATESEQGESVDELEKVASLTLLPRQYEASVIFVPPSGIDPTGAWRLEIKDETDQVIKRFEGSSAIPKQIEWDGKNTEGKFLLGEKSFSFTLTTPAKQWTEKIPALAPVFKLRFADQAVLAPEVVFGFKNNPAVKNWQLSIQVSGSPEAVFSTQQASPLPIEWIWDGKQSSGVLADSGLDYTYVLEMEYTGQLRLFVCDRIAAIPARTFADAQGNQGILISGVNFDFNRAEIKPEMTIKLLAAARILKSAGTKALCEGHADEIGSAQYNQELSVQRAKMAAKFLLGQPGINASQLAIIGFGKNRPENTLNTEEGRSRNRRVEIRLTFPKP